MSISFCILGSASGVASKSRICSGLVMVYNKRLLLFDCGSGVTRAFLRVGFAPGDVDQVFISHMHADHVSDLPYFLQVVKHSGPRGPLTVNVPEEAVAPLGSLLTACYLFPDKLDFGLTLKPHDAAQSLYENRVIVQAIPNRHLKHELNEEIISGSGYPNLMQSYSFLIEAENRSLLYSSDLRSLEDIESHVRDLDLLIIETTHIDLDRLSEIMSGRNIKRMILTHIAEEDEERVHQVVRSYTGPVKLAVAEEGRVFTL